LQLDVKSIRLEAEGLGKTFEEGDTQGITKIFFITPNLSASQKTIMQDLIDAIGTGSITP